MRLFIAINFNEKIKESLVNSIESLKRISNKGNFTKVENLHLTLAFIGETNNVRQAIQAMDSTHCSEFTLNLSDLGRFKRNGGDIYWAGIENNPILSDIAEGLSSELKNRGFKIDDRRFKPHITIGREVVLKDNINFSIEKASMTVSKISLMKSERINGKIKYTEIYCKTF